MIRKTRGWGAGEQSQRPTRPGGPESAAVTGNRAPATSADYTSRTVVWRGRLSVGSDVEVVLPSDNIPPESDSPDFAIGREPEQALPDEM